MTAVDGTEVEAQLARALAAGEIGDDETAGRIAAALVAQAPELEQAHRILAVTLFRAGDHVGARRHSNEALRLRPDHWAGHALRAQVDLAAQDVDARSREAAERAVELGPDEPRAHAVLGAVAAREGDFRTSAQAYARAIELGSDEPGVRHDLAFAQAQRYRVFPALRGFATTLGDFPQQAGANLRMALARIVAGYEFLVLLAAIVLLGPTADHDGRPIVLAVAVVALLAVFGAGTSATLRCLRPAPVPELRQVLADAGPLRWAVTAVLAETACLTVAAIAGAPLAYPLVVTTLVVSIGTGLFMLVVLRTRRLPRGRRG